MPEAMILYCAAMVSAVSCRVRDDNDPDCDTRETIRVSIVFGIH